MGNSEKYVSRGVGYLGGLGHCAVTVVRLDRSGCLLGWLGDPGTLWRRSAHAPVCPRVSKWLTDHGLHLTRALESKLSSGLGTTEDGCGGGGENIKNQKNEILDSVARINSTDTARLVSHYCAASLTFSESFPAARACGGTTGMPWDNLVKIHIFMIFDFLGTRIFGPPPLPPPPFRYRGGIIESNATL